EPASSAMATAPGIGPSIAAAGGGTADDGAATPVTAAADMTVQSPSAAATDPIPGIGHARLRMSFSADSWVDVHDAGGRRLFAGRGHANSVKVVAGAAPMRVYLGFASGVQLEVNDRVVAIGPQFVAGDAARFEAGADGVLRRDAHAPAAGDPQPRG
ncbi:MAG TPA: DUF4115 domain-containing protein, partial [Steroidobacteraceae bacterium]|nr:DUF4115 domain-containing protein [Steroidobacteraceae bacterium]